MYYKPSSRRSSNFSEIPKRVDRSSPLLHHARSFLSLVAAEPASSTCYNADSARGQDQRERLLPLRTGLKLLTYISGLSSKFMADGSFLFVKNLTRTDAVDSLSLLPEPILENIMSFLPFKDVVKTSVLSKTWEKLWRMVPDLEFDENWFGQELQELKYCYLHNEHNRFDQIRQKLLKCWKKILASRPWETTSLRKLALKTKLLSDLEFVDQCVEIAIENKVKVLKLEIRLGSDLLYNLPQTVLCSKSIHVLELHHCRLESPPINVKLESLRDLYLSHVNASDQVLENLVGGCPVIEDLSFEYCGGFKSLKLFDLHKLSKIMVNTNRKLEQMKINALNAREITVLGPRVPSEIDIASCKKLRFLSLCMAASVVDKWLSSEIARLPHLEFLAICSCHELQSIKISSSNLKRLRIWECRKLTALELETPNLSKLEYTGEIISFTFGALSLLEADFYIYSRNINNEWSIRYVELVAKLQGFSKVLNLQNDTGESVIVPRALRHILPPPLFGVKNLNFVIRIPYKSFPIAQVVDGLLWMSPHAETVAIVCGFYFKKFCFQFSYKEQHFCGEETARCCKHLPVSCWELCIKKVEIEIIREEIEIIQTPIEDKLVRKSESKCYVFEDAKLWGKIDNFKAFGED